ncbi:MAG TPA: ABC transporter ATP-binding protein [Clostridiaceae bacterium]|nr:ABC transporter ATP-binding protein [Clostridiaceae bacterium]
MTAGYGDYSVLIKDLHYSIDDVEILKEINLCVGKGELVGLIGPNGAGKSTLLKCISGIYSCNNGEIYVNGMDIKRTDCKKIAREVALMHQNTNVTFPFPAIDVVLTGRYPYLKRFETESSEDYRIARKHMSYTDTLKFESKPVTNMSGGERQRVLFAKVLTQETHLILLDEPTASLDISYEEQIFKYCCELVANGKTVIAAVHDLKLASRYCSRLVLMKDGKILSDGSVEEVLTPENLSVAYGVRAVVYRNRITGLLDFYTHKLEQGKPGKKIHVIGGGGSASGIMRQLFEYGHEVSTGVLFPGDSDLQCADVFGIKAVVTEPFNGINEQYFNKNVELIKNADLTILCNMPFGIQNIRNLEAASYAQNLVIVEDDPPMGRDYTGGQALEIYNKLAKKAIITTSAKVHEVI